MQSSSKVSVIIPTYNRAKVVVRAVRSALEQTSPPHEIIVVDDGSTDETETVLARAFGANAIRYHRRAQGGVAAARNDGVALACGDLLAFLDSDDEWMPDKLAAQMQLLAKHQHFGMVLTDVVFVDEQGREMQRVQRRRVLPVDGFILAHVLRNPYLVPSSALLTRQVWDDVGGFDVTLPTAEDLDFHLRVAARHQIALIERPLVRYMRGDHGLSGLDRTYFDHVHVVERFVASHRARLTLQQRRDALFFTYAKNARGVLLEGAWGGAASLVWRALMSVRSVRHVPPLASLAAAGARRIGTDLRTSARHAGSSAG